jgi:hypothetical protein
MDITSKRARLLLQFIPQKGHYPRTRTMILFNKIIRDLVFLQGFFQGLFTRIYLCNECVWFLIFASIEFIIE